MRRFAVFANLLLTSLLLAGCTTEMDLANLQDNTLHNTQPPSDKFEALQQQVARLEKAEAERQRSLIRMTADLDALRLEQRKLRGELEELQYHQGQTGTGLEDRLAALDQRLRNLERRSGPGMPPVSGPLVPDDEPRLLLPGSDFEPEPPVPPAEPDVAEPPSTPEPEVVQVEPPTEPEPPSAPEPEAVPVEPPAEPERVVEPPVSPPADSPEAIRLFQRARDDYQQGNYEVAIILFKQYLRQHPQATQAGDAQYWIGESLYAQKEYNAAIVAFDEVIQQYPQNEKVSAATLKVGLSFANLDDKPNARFFLQQVQEKFPNSAEAQLATEKLKQLRR